MKNHSTLTEIRPGIGLCDACGEPRWPQQYVWYGNMVCLDCIQKEKFNEQTDKALKAMPRKEGV